MVRTIWLGGPAQPIGHKMVKWPWGFSGSSGHIRTSVAMHGDTFGDQACGSAYILGMAQRTRKPCDECTPCCPSGRGLLFPSL